MGKWGREAPYSALSPHKPFVMGESEALHAMIVFFKSVVLPFTQHIPHNYVRDAAALA